MGIDLNSSEWREAEKAGNFSIRRFVVSNALPDVMRQTAEFIDLGTSPTHTAFKSACDFFCYDLEDVFDGSCESLSRCGMFPLSELTVEFDAFQTLLLQGNYKNTRDSMRRMLDVTLSSIYFLRSAGTLKSANEWVRSEGKTPFLSDALKKIIKTATFQEIEKLFNFSDSIRSFYGKLSDYCHTKGLRYSTRNPKNTSWINDVSFPVFSKQECLEVVNTFVEMSGWLAVLFAAHNKFLLVSVDKEAKWGMNGPISGFFTEKQTNNLLNLMPKHYASFFRKYAMTDPDCINVRNGFDKTPDLSESDFQQQIAEWKRIFEQ